MTSDAEHPQDPDPLRVRLERAIGHRFEDPGHLVHALTHSSFAHEQNLDHTADNERMEFLGDAILGLGVSAMLYRHHPDGNEGQLTRFKAQLVSSRNLARHARSLELGESLRLGKGEEKTWGRSKPALLADAFEALLAAVYLDGGLDAALGVVERLFAREVADPEGATAFSNYKSAYQEALQSRGVKAARYRTVAESGPDHRRTFFVEVIVNGEAVASGEGLTKKAAEQAAARQALEALSEEDRPPGERLEGP
jgi:ribonuclease-3